MEPEEKQDVMWSPFTLNIVLLTFVTTVARNSILLTQEMFIFQEIIRKLINKNGSLVIDYSEIHMKFAATNTKGSSLTLTRLGFHNL